MSSDNASEGDKGPNSEKETHQQQLTKDSNSEDMSSNSGLYSAFFAGLIMVFITSLQIFLQMRSAGDPLKLGFQIGPEALFDIANRTARVINEPAGWVIQAAAYI